MKRVEVHVGDQVFAQEGASSFGAVRLVQAHHLYVAIEGAGDIEVPATAVRAVHDGKVVLDLGALPEDVRLSIARAHDRETQ